MTDNKADAPNPAMKLRFQCGRHRRGVGDLRRYAAGKARLIKQQLFALAAALSEAPGRYVACQITARVGAAPSEQ